jgi:hypothetical protein
VGLSCKKKKVLHKVKEERNFLLSVKISRANWIGHILPGNCRLKHVIAGNIEVTGRQVVG